ncbi:hypothetical protein Q8G48_28350, partial [Klebsiella pneumoniae]|uniref:hypothetical protein n=1 Tax=Klebsiella pneumoniae TaxID=573 RepID=UPI0030141840
HDRSGACPSSHQTTSVASTGREMIPSEQVRALSWHPRRELGAQLTKHRGGMPCRIPDQLRRYTQVHMLQCIIDGLS